MWRETSPPAFITKQSKTTSIIVTHLENQQSTLTKVIDNSMSWAVRKQM